MFLYIGKELGWSCICKLFSKAIYYRFPKSCEVAHKPIGQAQNPDVCKALAMKGRVLQRKSCSFLKERPFPPAENESFTYQQCYVSHPSTFSQDTRTFCPLRLAEQVPFRHTLTIIRLVSEMQLSVSSFSKFNIFPFFKWFPFYHFAPTSIFFVLFCFGLFCFIFLACLF